MSSGQNPTCRILVVEDHRDTAFLLAHFLRMRGHDVTIESSYMGAIHAARTRTIDMLVIDIGLPDGDGCDLLCELRKDIEIRAVAVTGYGEHPHRQRCKDAGFDAFFLKPLSLEELAHAIEVHCPELQPR